MNKNQKGFSLVEGLLILVIVGLVGFVGWYVWQSKNKTIKQTNIQDSSKEANAIKPDRIDYQPKDGYVLWKDDEFDFSFTYPKDWTRETIQGGERTAYLKSSDYFVEKYDKKWGDHYVEKFGTPPPLSAITKGAEVTVKPNIGRPPTQENEDVDTVQTKLILIDGLPAMQKSSFFFERLVRISFET